MPVVPVQLPAESLGVMFEAALRGPFSDTRLSTCLVNVLMEGSVCE